MPGPVLVGAAVDRAAVERVASAAGVTVEIVEDEPAARRCLAAGPVGAMVLDAGFAYLDRLIESVRGAPETRDVAVLAVLDETDSQTAHRVVTWGADDVVLRERLEADLRLRLAAALEPAATGDPIAPARAVALVDASTVRQAVYADLLAKAGYRVVPARSVEEAIARLPQDVEALLVETSLPGALDLPERARGLPAAALVAPGEGRPNAYFRVTFDRTGDPEGFLGRFNELMFVPESGGGPTQRRRFPALVRLGEGEGSFWGFLHSLNSAGMFVQTLVPLRPGAPASLAFRPPDESDEVVLPARVAWRMPFASRERRRLPAGLGLVYTGSLPDGFRRGYPKLRKPAGAVARAPTDLVDITPLPPTTEPSA